MINLQPFPRVLRIEPASQCNLSCLHCPTGTVDMDRGIMSNNTFKNILKNIEENIAYIKVVVLYHGGEPLLNKNFFQYVSSIKKLNPEIFIKTVSNGMALTESTVKKIINSEIDAIEFSLDGLSAEESQYIRVKSKSSKVIRNVKNLIQEKLRNNIQKPTISIATTQFIKHSDIGKIPAQAPIPDWLLSEFGDEVAYKPEFAMRWPHMGDISNFELVETVGNLKNYCDNVISTITVRADGTVVPCCFDLTSKLNMGNVNSDSLSDIWNGEGYKKLRKSINERTPYSICSNCAIIAPPVYLVPNWAHEIKLSS